VTSDFDLQEEISAINPVGTKDRVATITATLSIQTINNQMPSG